MNLVVKQLVNDIVTAVIEEKQEYAEVSEEILENATDEVKEEVLNLTSWLNYVDLLRLRVDELCIDNEVTPEELGFTDAMADTLLAEWN